MKKEFPVLYKYTTTGKVQQWQVISEGDKFWTIEGIQGGKLTTSLPTYTKAKNVGKKNATTPEEQAVLEASAKWQKKKDSHYNEELQEERSFFEPMLAKDYKDYVPDFKSRVFVQPKLDGLRCINQNNELMSRNGKPFVTCPHLHQSVVILDGELYNHEFKDNFNAIVSLIKRDNPTEFELDETRRAAQYWIYDFPQYKDLPFSERHNKLVEWFSYSDNVQQGMILVPTFEVHSEEEIKERHAEFIGQGYEGTIVRIDGVPYETKRSKSLLKFKDFIDEEFEIVGFEEGEGGRVGTIGKFICKHDKKPNVTFGANVKGNHDYLRQVWIDRESYIGKSATVKYFNRTPEKEDGTGDKPRFGFVIKVNRESYE